ncbi:MAG: hypothetical protein R2733_21185 [Acidimicrobiales bacterium]
MVAQDDKFRVLRKLPEVRFEEELRGYSKSQVDRVLQGLAPLADDVASLQQRLADAEARAASAEARLVEARAANRAAAPSAAPAVAPAAAPAAVETPAVPANFDETLSKTLLLAQRTADQTVADARAEAESLVAAARAEAARLDAENAAARRDAEASVAAEREALLAAAHAEVQAKVEAAEAALAEAEGAQREALVAEIAEYTATRDELGLDIERLEGHLAQRRETIRAALADIAMVVDDPGRLHSEMPTANSDPVTVPEAGTGAVVLAVDGLDDLAPSSVSDTVAPADARGSLLGELDHTGEPTEAVPMVQLFDDDADDDPEPESEPTAGVLIDHDEVAGESPANEPGDVAALPIEENEADALVTSTADEAADATDQDLDDWGTVSSLSSGAVIVDEVRWDDAPSPAASPADFGFEDAADHVPSSPATSDELGRPAWAEAVPDFEPPRQVAKSEDPFLDELRRATGDDAETDVALERFLNDNDNDDDRRSGWFSRRK